MLHPAAIDASKSISWKFKQSKFKQLDGVLPCRWVAAGPSGAGKSVVLQQLILKFFRTANGDSCFERVTVFSPTAKLDVGTWGPVKTFIEELMGVNLKKEPAFYTEFDVEALEGIIKKHANVVQKQKDRGDGRSKSRPLFQQLLIVDDFGDDASHLHRGGGSTLNRLYLSGRHSGISTILSVQKINLVSVPIRVNATGLLAFKVRNQKEKESIES